MLETLRNAFKIKDIRNRILFTFMMLIVIRIGSELPIPGVKGSVFQSWLNSKSTDGLGFFDAVTGGSFSQMSVFALNITPYITSSIIMQLLTIAIPKLEELQRDGEEGRKKIVEITRYLTIALALIEAIAMVVGFYRSNYLTDKTPLVVIMVVTSLTAGSAVLMWIGERITEKGVGNGISIVLTINIISRIPQDLSTLWEQFIKSAANVPKAIVAGLLGMQPDDMRIPHSMEIAEKKGIKVTFGKSTLKEAHPNSAQIILTGISGKQLEVVGESLGGSRINIAQIDGITTNFSGDYPTLVVHNQDQPGHVSEVTSMLAHKSVNIATMQLYRSNRGGDAVMVLECDQEIPREGIEWLKKVEGITKVTYLSQKGD